MSKTKKTIWFLSILSGILVLCVLFVPDSKIQRHRNFVTNARREDSRPRSLRQLFGYQIIGWLSQRGISELRRQELGKEHEDALVDLGYFDRRTYKIRVNDPTALNMALGRKRVKDELYTITCYPDRVEVLAEKSDFEIIEPMLMKY